MTEPTADQVKAFVIAGLVALLHGQGAVEGAAMALCHAVMAGHVEVARWLHAHAQPELTRRNFRGKTAQDSPASAGSRP